MKTELKDIKHAIIFVYDPSKPKPIQHRMVVFGDMDVIFNLLANCGQQLMKRIQEVKKLKPESKKEIKKALSETKTENWFPNQPYKAFNDTEKFKITIENENNLP